MAEWKQISKGNGIGAVSKGHNEQCGNKPPFLSNACDKFSSEVFVSDQTSSLFAVDARNGRVIYGYKGMHYHGSLVLTIYTIV